MTGQTGQQRDERASGALPLPESVAAARRLLPRLWAGEDVDHELERLMAAAQAAGDVIGECAALYTDMAAASVRADLDRGRTSADRLARLASEHGLPEWQSAGRQFLARLALADGNEDVALGEIVEAELLVDDSPASIGLGVALNGIAVTYSRLGLFEDADRIYARLGDVAALVRDDWAEQAFVYNRMLNQVAWALSLLRTGAREAAHRRLNIGAHQARGAVDMSGSQARFDFQALCLSTDLMIGDIDVDQARERLEQLAGDISTEPESFVRFALAYRLGHDGDMDAAREEIDAGLAAVHPLEGEPVRSMLVWERARIAVVESPDHPGLQDVWAYAQLTTSQVWELRLRRVEAARDRLRIGRLRRDHQGVQRALLEDPLTGTANRRRLDAERAKLLASEPGDWVTVVYIDIDGFKAANDTYGHDLGDGVLRLLAGLLRSHTRDGDVVGRYGGDEFVILAPHCTPDDAQQLGERLLTEVRAQPWQELQPALRIRISIGIASTQTRHSELFAAADEALYEAKRAGRDRAELTVLTEQDNELTAQA